MGRPREPSPSLCMVLNMKLGTGSRSKRMSMSKRRNVAYDGTPLLHPSPR
jgi:hypothetical protein